jgi:predicted site-specific integrase-resolvase
MADRILNARELATVLHCSSDTVLAWARAGRIPRIKLAPNRIIFDVQEVLDALKATRGPKAHNPAGESRQ